VHIIHQQLTATILATCELLIVAILAIERPVIGDSAIIIMKEFPAIRALSETGTMAFFTMAIL